MASKHGPFIFTAAVVVGCLATGLASVIFAKGVPSLVVSVILACGVASLLYGIIGGVTEAGFDFGPLKVGGSAAVLLGGVWLFNQLLDPQLEKIRQDSRIDQYAFDFDKHANPPDGWFAVDRSDGVPIRVEFTDPVTGEVDETIKRPAGVDLPLKLAEEEGRDDRYLILGSGADPEQSLGYIGLRDLISAVGSLGGRKPARVFGSKNLYLTNANSLPDGQSPRWGSRGPCLGEKKMPFLLEVSKFDNEFADFHLTRCGSAEGAVPDHSSSLASGQSEIVGLEIEGRRREFLIAVAGARHWTDPAFSTFVVVEMEAGG